MEPPSFDGDICPLRVPGRTAAKRARAVYGAATQVMPTACSTAPSPKAMAAAVERARAGGPTYKPGPRNGSAGVGMSRG